VPHSHVTADDVALFVAGRLQGPALRGFLRQALSGCRACREAFRFSAPMLRVDEVPPPDDEPQPPDGYEAALDAVLDRVEAGLGRHTARWAEEKKGLAKLRAKSGDKPFDGDYKRFKATARRVPGRARIEHLMELSHELRYRDPERMWLLALGAASAASNLGVLPIDEGRYTPEQKDDLRARTQIELANALRLNHNLPHAEDCLEEAAKLAEKGHCDPQTEARLMDVYASVLMDQRQLDEALVLLDKLHRHYLKYGETHLAGRALISKGIALSRSEKHQEAANLLPQALTMLDPTRDPKLKVNAHFELLHSLVDCGDFHKASRVLLESGLRQAFADDPLNLLKLRWVEGKIFAGLKKLRRAEQIFTEVKEEFLRHDREYLVAMLDLELATVLLRQGRPDEVEPLAEEALEIFRDLEVGREALKAVRYLREACRRKVATAEIVQQVVGFLNRLEQQPGLRFVP
jgi:tetratricopeptide (TPR) repeat protein